jgi:hypothetical protein
MTIAKKTKPTTFVNAEKAIASLAAAGHLPTVPIQARAGGSASFLNIHFKKCIK